MRAHSTFPREKEKERERESQREREEHNTGKKRRKGGMEEEGGREWCGGYNDDGGGGGDTNPLAYKSADLTKAHVLVLLLDRLTELGSIEDIATGRPYLVLLLQTHKTSTLRTLPSHSLSSACRQAGSGRTQ